MCTMSPAAAAAISSVVSDSVRPHRRQPTRLLHPWDSPGKNTGVGCHFLLQCMKVKNEREVAQSCPTLSDPMDCSPPGSSAHGIFQARVLEWGAVAFSVQRAQRLLKRETVRLVWIVRKRNCMRASQVALVVKNPPANAGDTRDSGLIPGSERSDGWRPTPVFLPGKFRGQSSLLGCSPWSHKESDTTEHARSTELPRWSDGKDEVF